MKERFEALQWERLLRLPVHLFHAVSLADREMQEEEVVAFASAVALAPAYKDALQCELFADLGKGDNFTKALGAVREIATDGASAIMHEYLATKKLLEEKLTTEEYHRFLVSLIKFGMKVAEAAGEGPNRFSLDEQQALDVFLDTFAVDVEVGAKALDSLP